MKSLGYFAVFLSMTLGHQFAFAADGELDLSFGTNGKVRTMLGLSGTDRGRGTAIQSDGKIVVVGSAAGAFGAVRYNANGTLDTTFDLDGRVTTQIGADPIANPDSANAVCIQSDGKIVVVGNARGSGGTYDFAIVRYNTDGSLDTTFDIDGIVTTAFDGVDSDAAYSVAIQFDGKIIAAGTSGGDFAIARYETNGALDINFDSDGKLKTSIGPVTDVANAVGIQPDGKIVAAGFTNVTSPNKDIALVRYNSTGSLDTTFDTDGIVTTALTASDDVANALVIQSDGKIVIAGYSFQTAANQAVALRYSADGSLDSSFGSAGIRIFRFINLCVGGTFSCHAYANSVALQSDGKILLGGYQNHPNENFGAYRLNTNGTPDTTFNSTGGVLTPVSQSYGVAIQSDGRIVLAGYSFGDFDDDFALVRYNTNGSLDSSFDGDGVTLTNVAPGDSASKAVETQADGKIVVVGNSYNNGKPDFSVARFMTDGSLDTSFDGDGRVTTNLHPFGVQTDDWATSVAIQPDGKIVLAGYYSNGSNLDIALVRYNIDGSLDTSFDTDGRVTTAIGAGDDKANSVKIQPDGKIVVGGITSFQVAIVRYNSDGSLDTTFDGDGIASPAFGGSYDEVTAIALQTDGKIVASGSGVVAGNFDITVSRFLSNGSLDPAFDTDGFSNAHVGTSSGGYALELQSNGKIIVSGGSNTNGDYDLTIIRFNDNGSLDSSFDSDGIVTTTLSSFNDFAYGVAIQPNGKILACGGTVANNDLTVIRYNENGSLDNSFGVFGMAIYLVGQSSTARDVALQADGKILVTGESDGAFLVMRMLSQQTPTSANAFVSGRAATATGQGIRNAIVTLTDSSGHSRSTRTGSFGFYRLDDVAVGENYVLTINSKRFVFVNQTRIISVSDDVTDADFIAIE